MQGNQRCESIGEYGLYLALPVACIQSERVESPPDWISQLPVAYLGRLSTLYDQTKTKI